MAEFNLYLSEVEERLDLSPPCFASRTVRYRPFDYLRSLHLPQRNRFFEFIATTPAKHSAMQADAQISRLLPVVSATAAQIRTRLQTPVMDLYTAPQLVALRNLLEGIGFDTRWTTADTTLRDLIRRIARYCYMAQRASGAGPAPNLLFSLPLTTKVSAIDPADRAMIRTWIEKHSLDTSWIDGNTTVRQLIRFLHERIFFPRLVYFGVDEV